MYVVRRLGHRRGQYEIDRGIGLGTRLAVAESALGKAMLARVDEGERRNILASLYSPRGATPRTAKKALLAELTEIRERGIAISDQQRPGVYALAAAIPDRSGRVIGAIDVAMPADAVDGANADRYAREVQHAAKGISRSLEQ